MSEPSMVAAAEALVILLMAYGAIGIVFAAAFLIAGIHRVDMQAKGSGIVFRLVIFPGVAAFWPLLLKRWIRRAPEPPVETNAHRAQARRGGSW